MALNKAISSGKEHRKPWYGSSRFDYSCHPNKSCAYCRSNRTIQEQRERLKSEVKDDECS